MALDGAFLHTIKAQIESEAMGSRIDKIYQPSREEIVLVLRSRGWVGKLLLVGRCRQPPYSLHAKRNGKPKSPAYVLHASAASI